MATSSSGLIFSAEAVGDGEARGIPQAEFIAASAEDYEPDRKFGVILFNEVLFFVKDTEAQVARYARSLEPGGIIMISMHMHWRSLLLWERLEDSWDEVSSVMLAEGPHVWIIKSLRGLPQA